MIRLTDEMREHVNNAITNRKPCLLATASANGHPGIGYRGSMMVFDNEHLAYWERALQTGIENIRENPHVAVLYRDPDTRTGWRFYGDATVYNQDPIREQVWERTPQVEKNGDPEKKGVAVLIRVDRIMAFNNTVIQQREAS